MAAERSTRTLALRRPRNRKKASIQVDCDAGRCIRAVNVRVESVTGYARRALGGAVVPPVTCIAIRMRIRTTPVAVDPRRGVRAAKQSLVALEFILLGGVHLRCVSPTHRRKFPNQSLSEFHHG